VHILVLTDRDWTHPQGGGTGTNLYGQVSRWLGWGHRVSVIACGYPGAPRREQFGELTIHRMGGRSTVFPRAIWAQWRGLVDDPDVTLEVVNGITFLTPLWLRTPRVTLVHHVHRDHYIREMGRAGSVAAWALETAPLKLLYGGSRFLTISDAAARDIAAHGIPREQIEMNYLGVELDAYQPGPRADHPTLLYLGRLKRYKRIELLLDVVERIPEATLEMAGEGDHREAIEHEIARRGLAPRVLMHGHVSEEKKLALLQRAWVNMTASSAEGWCLSVMEAAACGTPSVAMAVGGLPESIEDGETGLLAHTPEELVEKTRLVVDRPDLRERLGAAARERAAAFTWEGTAEGNLRVLEEERERRAESARGAAARARGLRTTPSFVRGLAQTDTGRAGGLALSVISANLVALAFTIVFARLLGASDYGSLAALLSAFIILMVPGSALQIAVARDVSTSLAAGDARAGAGVRRWLTDLLLATAVVALLAIPLRHVLAAVLNVEEAWAAAAVPLTAMIWMLVSVERGALQGLQRYKLVAWSIIGEAGARLGFALLLVGIGLDVTGAFLGTVLALAAVGLVLAGPLFRQVPHGEGTPLRDLLAGAWAPVIGLMLLFALQELHVIVVKHEATGDAAGSYAVAAVAAKAIIWVAVGLGMYLLPEAARRVRGGEDARPILLRTLALIAAAAVPMVLIYAVAAKPLLGAVFGQDLTEASGALPWLGLAMALLACAYLSVQYLLAIGRRSFIGVLAAAAAVEVLALLAVGANLTGIALALFGLQLLCAASMLTLSLRAPATRTPVTA
jgi:glycosyltransferase involved in cell wall biosynthesis/O-antigen/teichoic acid export membrane protein